MKRFLKTVLVSVIVLASVIAGAVFIYSKTGSFTGSRFPQDTSVNGVDCSGLTYDEAADRLTEKWNSRELAVTDRFDRELAVLKDFGCRYDIDSALETSKKDNIIAAAANHFIKTPLAINIPMKVERPGKRFRNEVVTEPFLNDPEAVESRDAYVDLSDPAFPIVPEVYGTRPDPAEFLDDVIAHIENREIKLVFEKENYLTPPKITADDVSLKEYQQFCKENLKQQITYELGDSTFTISPEEHGSLLAKDNSGKADPEAVSRYVEELAGRYDNAGTDRDFTTPEGDYIRIKGGTYGWTIDQAAETQQLISDLESSDDVKREPVFLTRGYGTYSDDIGDTYIDVNITTQTVKAFIDGEKKFTSKCVTGCRNDGNTTDTGAFYILNKLTDVVLKGNNNDGSEYETPVRYWLGMTWSGQGLHDAGWRNRFGGDIWISDGSHGCINMPPDKMAELYSIAEAGMPIVSHY